MIDRDRFRERFLCWDLYTATFDAVSLNLPDLRSETEVVFRGEINCGSGCGCSIDAPNGGIGQGCAGKVIKWGETLMCWSPAVADLGRQKEDTYKCPNEACVKLFDPQLALDHAVLMGIGELTSGTVIGGIALIGLASCCALAYCMKQGKQQRIVRFVNNHVPVAQLS